MNCTKYSLLLIGYDLVYKIIVQESLQHLEDITIILHGQRALGASVVDIRPVMR